MLAVNTRLLFQTGYAGGSHYTHKGGGSNHLCLPEQPHWKSYTGKSSTNNAYVHGAEYRFADTPVLGDGDNTNHMYEDVPCVVCEVYDRFSLMMIPGSDLCPDKWTTEYTGYLSAERYAHCRTEFVCLDEDSEGSVAGREIKAGVLFYPVQSVCGSLPCPPYANLRELACAVCTK